jgi:hypothetical protein
MPDLTLIIQAHSLDQRIDIRGFIESLRRDPQVAFVLSDEVRTGFTQFTIQVTFVPGFERPLSQELYEVYLQNQPQLPDEPVELRPNLNGDVFPPIQRFFGTQRGEPLRRGRDYQSAARRTFLVDEVSLVSTTPEPDPPSFWERLLKEDE